jgi:uncharacterized protein YjdB
MSPEYRSHRRVDRSSRPTLEGLDQRELMSIGLAPTVAVSTMGVAKLASTPILHTNAAPVTAVQFTGLVHIQDLGDQPLQSGSWAGTKGQSRRLEGIQLNIPAAVQARLGVQMMMHQQNSGDSPWVDATTFLGSRGQSLRIEGLAFRLTGPDAELYDIAYRAHLQDIGDTGIVENGTFVGTRGQSRRLEAIEVAIVPKGTSDPLPVDPLAPRDLRPRWAGAFEGVLKSNAPSAFRDSVRTDLFQYNPRTDRVDFSTTITWRQKIFGFTLWTVTATASGWANLGNVSSATMSFGSGSVFGVNQQEVDAMVAFFKQNAQAIRTS